eukprot:scaffold57092_cov57-Phaeocystis_antarctica.AAC.2
MGRCGGRMQVRGQHITLVSFVPLPCAPCDCVRAIIEQLSISSISSGHAISPHTAHTSSRAGADRMSND